MGYPYQFVPEQRQVFYPIVPLPPYRIIFELGKHGKPKQHRPPEAPDYS